MNAFITLGAWHNYASSRLAPGVGLGKSKSQIDNSTVYFESTSGLFLFFFCTLTSRIATYTPYDTRKASLAFNGTVQFI